VLDFLDFFCSQCVPIKFPMISYHFSKLSIMVSITYHFLSYVLPNNVLLEYLYGLLGLICFYVWTEYFYFGPSPKSQSKSLEQNRNCCAQSTTLRGTPTN
jgi:hypothetical protein